jgi:hypothetical protein
MNAILDFLINFSDSIYQVDNNLNTNDSIPNDNNDINVSNPFLNFPSCSNENVFIDNVKSNNSSLVNEISCISESFSPNGNVQNINLISCVAEKTVSVNVQTLPPFKGGEVNECKEFKNTSIHVSSVLLPVTLSVDSNILSCVNNISVNSEFVLNSINNDRVYMCENGKLNLNLIVIMMILTSIQTKMIFFLCLCVMLAALGTLP